MQMFTIFFLMYLLYCASNKKNNNDDDLYDLTVRRLTLPFRGIEPLWKQKPYI
jgi:hypothetical protein